MKPKQNPRDFSNQTIVVAGAAQGIGRATAELIHHRGGHIIALDISRDGLSEIQSELDLKEDQLHQIDLGRQVEVQTVMAKIHTDHKQVHALINSVGIVGPSNTNVEEIQWSDFEKTLAINLFGAIWITQAVVPIMKQYKYGRIVHLASIAGKEGNPGMSPYNVSKAGMIGFVKGVAKEVAPFGITINALAPAVINTNMNADTSEETLKYMISRIPMGRLGEVNEIAEILAFMASSACSFTTGFTFDASGGRATY
jgi:3-oxoacyl-[acyl-carrier protein] reductase